MSLKATCSVRVHVDTYHLRQVFGFLIMLSVFFLDIHFTLVTYDIRCLYFWSCLVSQQQWAGYSERGLMRTFPYNYSQHRANSHVCMTIVGEYSLSWEKTCILLALDSLQKWQLQKIPREERNHCLLYRKVLFWLEIQVDTTLRISSVWKVAKCTKLDTEKIVESYAKIPFRRWQRTWPWQE